MLIYIGVSLGMLSAVIGQRCEHRRMDLPGNPIVLRGVSGAAAIAVFALLISGFSVAWWVPFLAFCLGLVALVIWTEVIGRYVDPALASILTGAGSLIASCVYYL